MHTCIYLVIIHESRPCCIFFPFQLHVHKYAHKYFKNYYYKNGIHLVFKYVFNDVGLGPLVLEHKFHQQCLCTLSKIIGIWHPLTVLFMIYLFKDGLLFIKIVYKLKQISFQTNLLIIVSLKRVFDSPTLLTGSIACPAFSARRR